ncbi:P-loop containing nucleoside triphosphate hydrolase protein [Sporormia fimetaria CBS 119925]|uniref:P-loop containing nucleoside triphosphate hydrolase protein n=1 Tax=Sporormia fimetaria CBS 119925 TaxID=1340428 RepID=A0A6A6VKE0_9PLEO|nr:P-loop containing nucleoside triphosphate hydrolase protein [Sporormia fimetaria CBS 119925]
MALQFLKGEHFARYDPTAFGENQRALDVDGERYELELVDFSTQERDSHYYRSLLRDTCRDSAGVVLLYSVTDKSSFQKITTSEYDRLVLSRKQNFDQGGTSFQKLRYPYPAGQQRFGCILVGSKADSPDILREVDEEEARSWATAHNMEHSEIDAHNRAQVESAIVELIRAIIREEQKDAEQLKFAPETAGAQPPAAAQGVKQKRSFGGVLRDAVKKMAA